MKKWRDRSFPSSPFALFCLVAFRPGLLFSIVTSVNEVSNGRRRIVHGDDGVGNLLWSNCTYYRVPQPSTAFLMEAKVEQTHQ